MPVSSTNAQLGCMNVGGGPIPQLCFWENYNGRHSGITTSISPGQFSVAAFNIPLPIKALSPQIVIQGPAGGAVDNPATISVSLGFYTKTGSTYSLHASASNLLEYYAGSTPTFLHCGQATSNTLSANNYWVGMLFLSSTTAGGESTTGSLFFNTTFNVMTSNSPIFMYGSSTATTSALPSSFVSTGFDTSSSAWRFPYILITG